MGRKDRTKRVKKRLKMKEKRKIGGEEREEGGRGGVAPAERVSNIIAYLGRACHKV